MLGTGRTMNEKKTILLVEDQAILALAETQQLEKMGYTVHHVTTGEKAVQSALATDPQYDLILMDINLGPGIDGTQAAEQILNSKKIPVVFLSSHTEPEVVEKTEKITSYGYVVKNSGPTVLHASIKMAFKLHEAYYNYEKRNRELYALAEQLEQANEELTSAEEELRHREASLAESDARFRSVLELVPDMISIHDPDMNILYSNWRGFADVPEDRRRMQAKCYTTYRDLDRICPDCLAKTVLETGEALKREVELPEGMWVDIRAIPVLDEHKNVTMFVEWVRDITEEKEYQKKLKESEEEHRRLFETMSPGVVYHLADGTIIAANPAAEKILGLTVDQMNGKTSMDPRWKMVDAEGNNVSGSDHPAMIALRTGEMVGPCDRAVFVPERNEYVWLSITAIPLFHPGDEKPYQVYATFENISERKRTEDALKESEKRISSIFRSAPVGIGLVMNRVLQAVNNRVCRMTGFEEHELIGRSARILYPSDDEFEFVGREKYAQIEDHGTGSVETHWRKKDGTVIDVLLSSTPLDMEDLSQGVTFTALDITERKRVEDERRRQLSEKETVLREVHHRIKNNMAQVESLLSLQANSSDNPQVQTALQEAISRVQSIRVLYEKLLIGKDYRDVSAKDYIESLVHSLIAVFPDRTNVTVEQTIHDFTLSSKKAIPVGIIINELLTNTFKYAFPKRKDGHVAIVLDKAGKQVTLTISDNGVGLDTRETANKSPGFGLTIVRMLAEQLNGTYTVEGSDGTKSVLKFEV